MTVNLEPEVSQEWVIIDSSVNLLKKNNEGRQRLQLFRRGNLKFPEFKRLKVPLQVKIVTTAPYF